MPQRMLGLIMLPPVSLPIEKPTRPAAGAAPGPALEPEAPSSSSHGFTVCPPNQISLSARAPRLSFATSTAPAAWRRFTTAASSFGMRLREGSAEPAIEWPDPPQVDFGEALGGEFALLDPARELGYRGEGDVRIAGRQRARVGLAADKSIALGAGGLAGENGIIARPWCKGRFERDVAGTGASLVERG